MHIPEQDSISAPAVRVEDLLFDTEPPPPELDVEATTEIVVVPGPELPVTHPESWDSLAVPSEGKITPAEFGLRGFWNMSLGRFLPTMAPSPKEESVRDAVSVVQSATWERPMNVAVANVKGGSGKTLATVLLTEVLSDLRGGQVAAWEACEVRGTLADRVNVSSENGGIPQFLAEADTIASLHDVSQYLAVQPSHAHALTSPNPRAELRASDVETMRRVLDTYFALTITDTGDNALHPAWIAAVAQADVLVIPCMTSADSVRGVLDTLAALDQFEDPSISDSTTGLRSRVIVVAASPPGTGNVSRALAPIRAAGVRSIQRAPFAKSLARGTAVSLDDLSAATRRAWTQISADVVKALTEVSEIQTPV